MVASVSSLVCRDCGRPLTRHGRTGQFIHRSGGAVAACDLDSDHPPRPDWTAVGEVTCGACGEPATAGDGGRLVHADRARDADHPADPWATARGD